MGAGFRGLGLSSAAFPGLEQGAGSEVVKTRLQPAPIWDASVL